MRTSLLSLGMFCLWFCNAAFAAKQPPSGETPIPPPRGGFGLLGGVAMERNLFTVTAFGTDVKFEPVKELPELNLPSYVHDHGRVELGTGVGFLLQRFGGTRLANPVHDQGARVHLGIEPFNLLVDVHTRRDDYIEWLPMASVGTVIFGEGTQFLMALRGGGAIGTLGNGGARTAYGAAVYYRSQPTRIALELLEIRSKDITINLASFDFSWEVTKRVSATLRFETLLIRDSQKSPRPRETMGLLGFQMELPDWKWHREKVKNSPPPNSI